MTNLPGCSTSMPCIGFGVSLSHFCFQAVADKGDGGEGGVLCGAWEIREIEREREWPIKTVHSEYYSISERVQYSRGKKEMGRD